MNRFQKIGKAYRMTLGNGTALWIRRDRITHRYDLIHVYRGADGERAVTVLATFGSVKAAATAGHKDAAAIALLNA